MRRTIRFCRELNSEKLVELFETLPSGSTSEQIRAEAEAIFGEERVGND
jgi:hypothetical protein